jgi:hypothetical protein
MPACSSATSKRSASASRTKLAGHPGTRDLVLVLSAVNAIDTTALFGLLDLNTELAGAACACTWPR